jgi:ubiquinone/menaquinone biosynthesis C-methylase UbiE
MSINLWTSSEHALDYLSRADSIPHRVEGEAALLEFISPTVRRILDLGTGDGRLLGLVKLDHPEAAAVAIDFSPAMLEGREGDLERRLGEVVAHDLDHPLPELKTLTRWFPLRHPSPYEKRNLREVYRVLSPGGVFATWSM